MPKYDFKCCGCEVVEERTVPYDEIEKQICAHCRCGMKKQAHYQTLQVQIPEAFREANRQGYTQSQLEAENGIEGTVPVHGGRWV